MKAKLFALLFGAGMLTQLAFTDNAHYLDSLSQELNKAKNEIRRLHFQIEIATLLEDKDSAVTTLESVLNRSVEIGHPQLELEASKALGALYLNMQDLGNATTHLSRAQFISYQQRDTLNQAEATMQLAGVCSFQKKYAKSEAIYRQAEMLLQATGLSESKYKQSLGVVYHQHAGSFVQQGLLDSAQQTESKAVELFAQAGNNAERAMSLASLAAIQSKQNRHDDAIASLTRCLSTCSALDDESAPIVATGLSQLALEYTAAGNFKLAQQTADSALAIARNTDAPHAKVAAFKALAAVKEKVNDYKEALHYYDSAAVLSAQILSDQSAAKVSFAQSKYTHQAERAQAEKEEAASLRISTMRIAGISIFLITALVFAFAVSRHKHGPVVTKVLGAIALLLTFELISVAIHPLMEKWTHHSSLYMLLILAGIAVILVSLHHQIENMVKKVFHTEG